MVVFQGRFSAGCALVKDDRAMDSVDVGLGGLSARLASFGGRLLKRLHRF